MQWIVGHGPEIRLVIYIRYWNSIDFLQWNVKSTSELDSEEVSTFMGPSGPYSELIYHDKTFYEGLDQLQVHVYA